MKLRMDAIASNPEHLALYQLTIAGVGFMHENRHKYEFYSHEGDYIGCAPTYRVQAFVAYMRRNFAVERCAYAHQHTGNTLDTPLTYGYLNLVDCELVERWMQDLWKSPITLH